MLTPFAWIGRNIGKRSAMDELDSLGRPGFDHSSMSDGRKPFGSFELLHSYPVSNKEFTTELANALKRPAIIKVPKFMLKMAVGEFAEALL